MTEFEKKMLQNQETIIELLSTIRFMSLENLETIKTKVTKELKEIRENTNRHYV